MTDTILTMPPTPPKPSEQIAALQCTLEQAYLIEASAGTGKTWTLTGIILRLLIEKKYPPERIIATTFTRAAAAEIQERISERLHSFYGLMRWLQGMLSTQPEWFNQTAPIEQIITSADQAGYDAADPINEHLLRFILSQKATFLNEVVYRTGLLLTSLDKLFVGTLDSLAQKWLNEFAAQIGHQSGMEILNNAEQKVAAIVHDEMRAEEVRLKHAQPEFYQIFKVFYPNFFSQVDAVVKIVNKAINFYSAPIDELMPINTDISLVKAMIDQIITTDFTGFTPYFDANFRKQVAMNQSLGFGKLIQYLPNLLSLIQKHGVLFVRFVDNDALKLIDAIIKAMDKDWQIFNKSANPSDINQFLALPLQALSDIANVYLTLSEQTNLYHTHICRHIILSAKSQIAQRLETHGQTTFTLQMVRLNEALRNSPALARQIRHHYPVALIDESQDINGLQVELIELVYLNEIANYHKNLIRYEQIGGEKPKLPRGFLLLVGDPKQAIYRFRGGDVTNYNLIKHYGNQDLLIKAPLMNQSLSLTVNRRSSKALIEALNAWFDNNHQDAVANHANLGQGIFYQQIQAHKDGGGIHWQSDAYADYYGKYPIAVLHFDHIEAGQKAAQRAEQIARHINTILQGDHTLHGQKILPKDIAVLGRTADTLDRIKSELDQLNIPAIIPKEMNIFITQAADDLLALIGAILQPNHSENLGKFLVSSLVGMTLKQAINIIEPNDQQALDNDLSETQNLKTHLLAYLKKSYEKWQKFGVSSALAYALHHSPIDYDDDKSPWLKAATQGERYLVDLERLVALVSEQSQLHEMRIIAWYHKQMNADVDSHNKRPILPSESGVNLMTIHKSKGLEFPIVYVIGMDEKPKNENGLTIYPYTNHNFQRCLSLSQGNLIDENYYYHINQQELIDEIRRLGYVALTRASEQLYIVGGDLSKKTSKEMPLYQWLDCAGEKTLSLPDRLKGWVDWIDLTEADLFSQPYQTKLPNLSTKNYAPWDMVMTKTQFFGGYKTSFSALITRLDKSAISPDEADIDQLSVLTDMAASDQFDDIRTSFFKGSLAGDFLHKVMQFLPTDRLALASLHDAHRIISGVIYEQGRKLGIAERYLPTRPAQQIGTRINSNEHQADDHTKLVAWIYQLAYAPFRASHRSLMSLPMTVQLRELSFTLGLGDTFSITRLNEVFKAHSDKDLVLLDDDYHTMRYRYLRGEIDLVYECDRRFFIVDYKSNYLGSTPDEYHDHAMAAVMDKVGYWLQAAIYQVALHRLLKIRLKDYVGNEAAYLGAVEYVFLRGVQEGNEKTGHLCWQPPLSLILALDEIL